MNRSCKNCGSSIYARKSYCADCGAKWIDNRINMRNVAHDFSDLYLGFDTRFFRTVKDMSYKPAMVIEGYMRGVRVKHMDAIRFLLLALFVGGIFIFVIKLVGIEVFNESMITFYKDIGFNDMMLKTAGDQLKNGNGGLDYQGVIYFIMLPAFAFIGRIVFHDKRYNFTEHLVFYMYTVSYVVILSTFGSITLLLLQPRWIMEWSLLTYIIMLIYCAWTYKGIFNLSLAQTIWRSILAFLVVIIAFIIFSIAIAISGMVWGYITH